MASESGAIGGKPRYLHGLNRNVAVFFGHSMLLHVGLMGVTDVLLNFYLVSIGYEPGVIGLLQGLPRLGGFVTGLPVGLVANRMGNRRILVLSSYGLAASVAAVVIFPGLFLLGLSRFALGFFFGAGQVVTSPYMVTLTRREEHTAQFAYHNFVSMVAVATGSFVGGYLPLWLSTVFAIPTLGGIPAEQTPNAYRAALLIGALMVLLSVIPLYALPKDKSHTAPKPDEPIYDGPVPWGLLIKLSLPLFVFGISGGLTFPFYNLFFRERYGLVDSTVGTILALGWLSMALIPMLNPVWERRVGRASALTGLMIAGTVAFFGLGASSILAFAVPFYLLGIGLRNTMQPLYQPLLMGTLPPHLHALASSVGLVLWNIGWFGSTSSFGFLEANVGYGSIMLIVGVFVLLNGLAITLVFRKG